MWLWSTDRTISAAVLPRHDQKAAFRLNIFNSLNANTITRLGMLSGPSYGLATAILPPRACELSAS